LPAGISSLSTLGVIAFLLGVSINMYPLITTAVSETFGPKQTSSVMGVLNTFAQLCGATALWISGYLGMALNSSPGNALHDYPGIWLVAIVGCLGAAATGVLLPRIWGLRAKKLDPALDRR
jgi:MFS family permease